MLLVIALFQMAIILLRPQQSRAVLATVEILYQHTIPTLEWIDTSLADVIRSAYCPLYELCMSMIPLILSYVTLTLIGIA